jgi:hypothetical protein
MELCKISIGKKEKEEKFSIKKNQMIAPLSIPEEVHHYRKV